MIRSPSPDSTTDSTTDLRQTARGFARPRVVLSQCLELVACRHDGQSIPDPFVRRLIDHVDLVGVCPEVEIGLGTPRDTIRMVDVDGHTQLIQPATGLRLASRMERFSQRYLESLGPVDGFLLKAGSPSCGSANVKVYGAPERSPTVRTQPGLFARNVQDRFGTYPIEDEGRLRNYPIRHQFLVRLFASADFRRATRVGTVSALMDLQRRYKHVLMTHDQDAMRELGHLVASHSRAPFRELASEYGRIFRQALAEPATRGAHINTLMHMYGHFRKSLTNSERDEFLRVLDEVRDHHLNVIAASTIIRSWTARYQYDYFEDQAYLEPYPRELVLMRDSGKGLEF